MITNHSAMYTQIFLVVFLLGLGTANNQRRLTDNARLRQLLQDTEDVSGDKSRRHYSETFGSESKDSFEKWLQKYFGGSKQDSGNSNQDTRNEKTDMQKLIDDCIEQFWVNSKKRVEQESDNIDEQSLRKLEEDSMNRREKRGAMAETLQKLEKISEYCKEEIANKLQKESENNEEDTDEEWLEKFEESLKTNKKDFADDDSHSRRHHHEEDNSNADDSDRRREKEENEVEYLELRATNGSGTSNTGPVITLQNRAFMNTRLRVLYTDDKCSPFLAESGLLWVLQTKSVTLPSNARNVKIIVEKDLFAENWRVAYNGTLSDVNKCIRITGVTFSSKIKPCK